jgi:hypothetical protein
MKWDFKKISPKNIFKKENINSISLGIIIAGIIIGAALVVIMRNDFDNDIERVLSSSEAGERAVNFINDNLLVEGVTASLIDAINENGVYKIKFKIENEEFESYVSQDGRLLFVQGINIDEDGKEKPMAGGEIQKTDRPNVKLFVMSYCPFGLQSQKTMLPSYDLLGEKADIGVYFVNYIMHGEKEIDENLVQYCIQEELKDKYASYLNCFTLSGNSDSCLSQTGIDKNRISSCISATDQEYGITKKYNDKSTWLNGVYPKFDVHSYLNNSLGVSGSPTLVINDTVILSSTPQPEYAPPRYVVISEFQRTPEGYKNVICQAFNNPPEECSQVLSSQAPVPNFGEGTGESNDGSCE